MEEILVLVEKKGYGWTMQCINAYDVVDLMTDGTDVAVYHAIHELLGVCETKGVGFKTPQDIETFIETCVDLYETCDDEPIDWEARYDAWKYGISDEEDDEELDLDEITELLTRLFR